MKPDPIFTESGRGFFDTVPRTQDPPPDPPPYDAKAAQKAAEAKIDAWAKRLRLDKLKECQENGDTGKLSADIIEYVQEKENERTVESA